MTAKEIGPAPASIPGPTKGSSMENVRPTETKGNIRDHLGTGCLSRYLQALIVADQAEAALARAIAEPRPDVPVPSDPDQYPAPLSARVRELEVAAERSLDEVHQAKADAAAEFAFGRRCAAELYAPTNLLETFADRLARLETIIASLVAKGSQR